uniref:phosphoribosylaminoimidazolesuccinocarboxamide synthase n=1 Tax=Staphylococcus epidermidis TaxID=1282 RepID=UPI0028CB68E6
QLSQTQQLLQQLHIIPLQLLLRNIPTPSITKPLRFKNAHTFQQPLLQFFYKKHQLNHPLITHHHLKLLPIPNHRQIKQLKQMP